MGSALRALEPDVACPELVLDGGHLVPESSDLGSHGGVASEHAGGPGMQRASPRLGHARARTGTHGHARAG
jgi:hypothetical protein